jgi:hypothetical protein
MEDYLDESPEPSIPPYLWFVMGGGLGITGIFVAAVILNSLLLACFIAFMMCLLALAIWQRERLMIFTLWLAAHPNTHKTLEATGDIALVGAEKASELAKESGKAAGRGMLGFFRLLANVLLQLALLLLWLVRLPFRGTSQSSQCIGKVGGTYPINAYLVMSKETVRGNYYHLFYDRHGNRMKSFHHDRLRPGKYYDLKVSVVGYGQWKGEHETEIEF